MRLLLFIKHSLSCQHQAPLGLVLAVHGVQGHLQPPQAHHISHNRRVVGGAVEVSAREVVQQVCSCKRDLTA